MSTSYTTNYHLGKQLNHSDYFDMDVITDNMDTIDSALKSNADNISATSSTVSGHTTSISELQSSIETLSSDVSSSISGLQSSIDTLSSTVSGYSGDISSLETDVSRLTTNLDKYAIPQHLETDIIIVDSDISNFKNGVMVGMFSQKLWDRNASDQSYERGALFAYNLNPISSSQYFPEYIQILILNDSYSRKMLMRENSGSGWSNFTVLSMQERYCSSIDNSFLNNIARRRGIYMGDIATEISGLSAVERGVVRCYAFTDSIAYDDSNDCMQVCETVSGVRKTRWYNYMQNTWSAWV